MDYAEELRNNEIKIQSNASINMIGVKLVEIDHSVRATHKKRDVIKRSSEVYRENYIKVRNEILANVSWEIRPHVLYRVNKHFEHLL